MNDLRREDRDYPIVVLTFRDGADEPDFRPDAIRPVLDPRVPIYVLGTPDLCRRLSQSLGPRLAVDNGNARVLWPGVKGDSDPADHPLVPADGRSDRNPANRLISALELSRPGIRDHVAVTQERLQAAEQRAADALRELREARAENETVLGRARGAEASLVLAEQQLAALKLAGLDQAELEIVASMDGDARMHRLISREWVRAMPASDRKKYPLRYVFSAEFIKSVEKLTGTPLERIAWACAMVASGRAKEMPGLEPHQLRGSASASVSQQVRSDGAKAWICRLLGEGASRLLYWVTSEGVEFARVGVHEETGRL
jgi:hypothetical protein